MLEQSLHNQAPEAKPYKAALATDLARYLTRAREIQDDQVNALKVKLDYLTLNLDSFDIKELEAKITPLCEEAVQIMKNQTPGSSLYSLASDISFELEKFFSPAKSSIN